MTLDLTLQNPVLDVYQALGTGLYTLQARLSSVGQRTQQAVLQTADEFSQLPGYVRAGAHVYNESNGRLSLTAANGALNGAAAWYQTSSKLTKGVLLVGSLLLVSLAAGCTGEGGSPSPTSSSPPPIDTSCGTDLIQPVEPGMGLSWYSLWDMSGAQKAGVTLHDFVCKTHELSPTSLSLPYNCLNAAGKLDLGLAAQHGAHDLAGNPMYDPSDFYVRFPLFGPACNQ